MGTKVIQTSDKISPSVLASGAMQVGLVLGAVIGGGITTTIFLATSGSLWAIMPFLLMLMAAYVALKILAATTRFTMENVGEDS